MQKPRDPQSRLTAIYYRDEDGIEPVRQFIASLPATEQDVLDAQIDRLNDLDDANPHLPFPFSSQVDAEMRELRCHFGSSHYRILYCRSQRLIVLLHAFRKSTRAIPTSDIAIARPRWNSFKERMNESPRIGRRPAGSDAP